MSTSQQHVYSRRIPPSLKTTSTRSPKRPTIYRALSSPKTPTLGRKRNTEVEIEHSSSDDLDLDFEMSFLQYCPNCEKQIVIPNNSVLYCSESCRRKDANRAPSAMPSPTTPEEEDASMTTRTIVEPRKPSTPTSFHSIPPSQHSAKTDLDPTEWKPAEGRPTDWQPDIGRNMSTTSLPQPPQSSAAFSYLSQFHRSSASLAPTRAPRRPAHGRSLTESGSVDVVFLGGANTPPASSRTSSISSQASSPGTPDGHSYGIPTRQVRIYSLSNTKSVDLIKPVVVQEGTEKDVA